MTTPPKAPPSINPYVFPVLLAGFGLWCLYDGWFNPEMLEHQTFNRVAAAVLLVWALLDFIRTRKLDMRDKALRKKETSPQSEITPPPDSP